MNCSLELTGQARREHYGLCSRHPLTPAPLAAPAALRGPRAGNAGHSTGSSTWMCRRGQVLENYDTRKNDCPLLGRTWGSLEIPIAPQTWASPWVAADARCEAPKAALICCELLMMKGYWLLSAWSSEVCHSPLLLTQHFRCCQISKAFLFSFLSFFLFF